MKKSTVIILWGLITGVASVIFSQILYSTGQENSGLRWFNMLIMFIGIFVGTMQYRDKANGGYLTFGQGFKAAFFISLIITLVSTIAMIVDLQLHPEIIDKILTQSRDNMINKGMSDEQIETGLKYTKMFTTPFMLVLWTIVGGLFFSAILSLISAGLCSRNKPIFDNTNETSAADTPQA